MKLRLLVLAVGLALAACVEQPAGGDQPRVASPPPPPVRSRSESNRDDVLKSMIARRLADLDRRAMRGVTVEVWRGSALLMGAVAKPDLRRRAEESAAAVTGVAEVINELVLAEDQALDAFAPDWEREEAVRLALGIEGKAGIVVRVINGVAFLLGAVSAPEQSEAMKADALDVAGVKWAVARLKTP